MTHEEWALSIMRNRTARKAQEATRSSRYRGSGVMLQAWSEREDLIRWLVWCDSNGVWTDDDLRAEGCQPMTLQQAWDAVAYMLEDY